MEKRLRQVPFDGFHGPATTLTLPIRHAVLLHGLGRSSASMRPIARLLAGHGYEVLNLDYASRSADILTLARVISREIDHWRPAEPFVAVTHSLGGILLRQAVASGYIRAERIHRAVMLGPPNAGSELADQLPEWPLIGRLYRRFTGVAGTQLGTAPHAVPAQLPAIPFPTGVVAGTRSFNPLFSALLGAPNDGKVRVDRTRVDGVADFIALPYWHPLLMIPAPIQKQVLAFLETGQFDHRPDAS